MRLECLECHCCWWACARKLERRRRVGRWKHEGKRRVGRWKHERKRRVGWSAEARGKMVGGMVETWGKKAGGTVETRGKKAGGMVETRGKKAGGMVKAREKKAFGMVETWGEKAGGMISGNTREEGVVSERTRKEGGWDGGNTREEGGWNGGNIREGGGWDGGSKREEGGWGWSVEARGKKAGGRMMGRRQDGIDTAYRRLVTSKLRSERSQELCDRGGGRPGLPSPLNSPYGLCGRNVEEDKPMTVGDLAEAGIPRLFGAGHIYGALTKPKTATNDLPTYVSKVALSVLRIVQPKTAGHIYGALTKPETVSSSGAVWKSRWTSWAPVPN